MMLKVLERDPVIHPSRVHFLVAGVEIQTQTLQKIETDIRVCVGRGLRWGLNDILELSRQVEERRILVGRRTGTGGKVRDVGEVHEEVEVKFFG